MDTYWPMYSDMLYRSQCIPGGTESVQVFEDKTHLTGLYIALHRMKRFDQERFFDGLGDLALLQVDYGCSELIKTFGLRALGDYTVNNDTRGLHKMLPGMVEYASSVDMDEPYVGMACWELYKQAYENVPNAAKLIHQTNLNEMGKHNLMAIINSGYVFDEDMLKDNLDVIKQLSDQGSYFSR